MVKLIHQKNLLLGILGVTALKILWSYYIPLQLIPAPHDDLLFYRLAESVANLKWLGVFEQTTLIKGFSYPLFLSLSIFFSIPLRILEGALICSTSLYFVFAVKRVITNKLLILLLYTALIFYPFHYSLVDFRLLRDMIYSPLLLCIFSALFYIYLDANLKVTNRLILVLHPTVFSLALFFFLHTREEGIWIAPALVLFLIFIYRGYVSNANIIILLKKIFVMISVFAVLQGILLGLNTYKYRFTVVTILKDANFQSGFASLHRINSQKKWYEDISKQDWDTLFLASPAVAELRPFVQGGGYRFWTTITCDAMRSQGYNLALSDCPNVMPPGNVQFALMDALFQIGYRNPADISQYMGRVALEIDDACEAKKLKCKSKPPFMLSRNIFQEGIPTPVLWANIFRATQIAVIPKSISLSEFSSYFDLNMVPKMREKLGGYLFEPRNISTLVDTEKFQELSIHQFFISSHPNIVKTYTFISRLYTWFMAVSWLILIPVIYLFYKTRVPLGILIGGFLILFVSRILLISILDYYAMAPISSLYLMSGTYALFVAEIVSLVYLAHFYIKSSEIK